VSSRELYFFSSNIDRVHSLFESIEVIFKQRMELTSQFGVLFLKFIEANPASSED
jgi:hypothetical protein